MSEMWANWWAANELEVWVSLVLVAALVFVGAVVFAAEWMGERRQR